MSTSLVAFRQEYSTDKKGRQVVTMTRVLDTGLPYEALEEVDKFFQDLYETGEMEVDYDVANDSGHEYEFYGDVLTALIDHLNTKCNLDIKLNEDKDISILGTCYHVELY